ncbi:hypothetical protein THASP1DRAFT_24925 [Thamnocephalis sphaerospora]|uniref:Uncharacterized protein n=1 Tax=Thamnocephalis sphaerospora TaxID=78915 RepID=A0A4P9XN41_9FUNG|nr:hypothetical protein THASP1DRAFT_24925 [Thamnocephalis sphaerospora]|eukprot:RKP06821.1 hypothetical protein THASP1DRAFT_24925 [Thamnocephalis sphaerospora]
MSQTCCALFVECCPQATTALLLHKICHHTSTSRSIISSFASSSTTLVHSLFEILFGASRNVFYAMGACYAVLALIHLWRRYATKGWPHVAFAVGLILDSVSAFFTATSKSGADYLNTLAHLIYYCTLTLLVVLWTNSMYRRIGISAKMARAISYLAVALTVIWAAGSIALAAYLEFGKPRHFKGISVISKVPDGVILGIAVLMLLVCIWMLLVCPKESDIAGCNKKRWEIGMLAFTFFLLGLSTALRSLNAAITLFAFTLVLGIVTIYPVHTLSGHAQPPKLMGKFAGSSLVVW